MAQFGGDPKAIPKWESGDFDSIYILKNNQKKQIRKKCSLSNSINS